MIVVIDNYDSFVFNLARYIALHRGAGSCHFPTIIRNDAMSVPEILALPLTGLVISPGPKSPQDAGICVDLIRGLPPALPFLGVCLGHQCLVEALGGATVQAREPLHGRQSMVVHDGSGIFQGLENPMAAGRYHSLISILKGSDDSLIVCAQSKRGEIMGVRHNRYPWFGVQFHPESILTPDGINLIGNFVALCEGEDG